VHWFRVFFPNVPIKCSLVLQFFRIIQSFKFGHYVVFLHVFVVDTVHNVVCVDEVLAIVVNVLEVAGLALDHSVGFNIIIVFLIWNMYFVNQCWACLCLNYHIADKHKDSTHCVSLAQGIFYYYFIERLSVSKVFLSKLQKKQDNPKEKHHINKRNTREIKKHKKQKRNKRETRETRCIKWSFPKLTPERFLHQVLHILYWLE